MLGTIVGILFLMTLLFLLVASLRRILITYREEGKADVVAIIAVLLVLLIFVCIILLLLGPVIGSTINELLIWGAE